MDYAIFIRYQDWREEIEKWLSANYRFRLLNDEGLKKNKELLKAVWGEKRNFYLFLTIKDYQSKTVPKKWKRPR